MVSSRAYATRQEVRDWAEDQSLEVTGLQIESASLTLRRVTFGAVYAVDNNGMPTDPGVKAAFRDACAALVVHRMPPEVQAGLKALGLKSAQIGTANYTVADKPAPALSAGFPVLVHEILLAAGLIGGPVIVDG